MITSLLPLSININALAQDTSPNKNRSEENFHRIAALPASTYNADLSSFEKIDDLAKRYIDISYKFARKNKINYIINAGLAFSRPEFTLKRNELLEYTNLSNDSFINAKIYYIGLNDIMQGINRSKIDAEIEQKFQRFAKASNIDIIINSAIFASNKAKITSEFLNFINDEKSYSPPENRPIPLVCTISVPEILSTTYAKRHIIPNDQNSLNTFYKKVDLIISEYANKNGIDILLNAHPSASLCNVTPSIINALDEK